MNFELALAPKPFKPKEPMTKDHMTQGPSMRTATPVHKIFLWLLGPRLFSPGAKPSVQQTPNWCEGGAMLLRKSTTNL